MNCGNISFIKIKLLEWRVEKATVEATRCILSRSCLIPSPLGAVTELQDSLVSGGFCCGMIVFGNRVDLVAFIHKPPPDRGGIGRIRARCNGQVGRLPPIFHGFFC